MCWVSLPNCQFDAVPVVPEGEKLPCYGLTNPIVASEEQKLYLTVGGGDEPTPAGEAIDMRGWGKWRR